MGTVAGWVGGQAWKLGLIWLLLGNCLSPSCLLELFWDGPKSDERERSDTAGVIVNVDWID